MVRPLYSRQNPNLVFAIENAVDEFRWNGLVAPLGEPPFGRIISANVGRILDGLDETLMLGKRQDNHLVAARGGDDVAGLFMMSVLVNAAARADLENVEHHGRRA